MQTILRFRTSLQWTGFTFEMVSTHYSLGLIEFQHGIQELTGPGKIHRTKPVTANQSKFQIKI